MNGGWAAIARFTNPFQSLTKKNQNQCIGCVVAWTGLDLVDRKWVQEAWPFLVQFGFKVHRGLAAEGAAEPLPVGKNFDPFKDGGLDFGARGEQAVGNRFPFEAAPEAFQDGVVVAVACAAHAGDDARLREPLPVGAASVLHPDRNDAPSPPEVDEVLASSNGPIAVQPGGLAHGFSLRRTLFAQADSA